MVSLPLRARLCQVGRTGGDSPNPFVPIVMLTGHTELVKVIEARDSGVHEFLAKPISARSLYARIRIIIEKPREFIKTKSYFGPDRRRNDAEYKGSVRRAANLEESEGELSQDEVDALLNG